jgi:hypothetical protein
VKARALELELSAKLYGKEDAAAGALALGARARVTLRVSGGKLLVALTPAAGEDAAALEGEFLNEALAQRCRREAAALWGPLAEAVEASVRVDGFPPPSEDPLEELEPTVRENRSEDLRRLRARAEELKPR